MTSTELWMVGVFGVFVLVTALKILDMDARANRQDQLIGELLDWMDSCADPENPPTWQEVTSATSIEGPQPITVQGAPIKVSPATVGESAFHASPKLRLLKEERRTRNIKDPSATIAPLLMMTLYGSGLAWWVYQWYTHS